MRIRILSCIGLACLCLLAGCTFDSPVDPAGFFGSFSDPFKAITNALEDAITDPFNVKPYPVVIGGDSARVFYLTNLAEAQINFPGPTNDIVFPGFWGPSNLYKYQDGERELIRALVPAGGGLFGDVVTDGEDIVYLASPEFELTPRTQVVLGSFMFGEATVLFDAEQEGVNGYVGSLSVDQGRVAYIVSDLDTGETRLRIEELNSPQTTREIDIGAWGTYALRGDRLVYERDGAEGRELVLHNLATDEITVLSSIADSTDIGAVILTENSVVWSDEFAYDLSRIVAYDIPTGTTTEWADAVAGSLSGASDGYFLMEERTLADNDITERITIRLYELGGRDRKLADFRADGLAGQSCILGDRVVFVNTDRRIVLVPLDGSGRSSFRPF